MDIYKERGYLKRGWISKKRVYFLIEGEYLKREGILNFFTLSLDIHLMGGFLVTGISGKRAWISEKEKKL